MAFLQGVTASKGQRKREAGRDKLARLVELLWFVQVGLSSLNCQSLAPVTGDGHGTSVGSEQS